MRHSTILLLVLVCVLASSACSNSHGHGSAGGPIAIDELQNAFYTALCDFLEHCPQSGSDSEIERLALEHGPGGCEASARLIGGDFDVGPTVAQVHAGTLTYDAAAAGECFAALVQCSSLSGGVEAPACNAVFDGHVATGQPCTDSQDCAGDAYCDTSASMSSCGVCRPATALAGSCQSDSECTKASAGSRCSGLETSPSGTCVQVNLTIGVAAGQPCGRTASSGNVETWATCAAGSFCNATSTADAGVCVTPPAAGSACDGNTPCAGDAICKSTTGEGAGICTTVTVQTSAGQPCNEATLIVCSPLHHLVCTSGTCQVMGDGTAGSPCAGAPIPICNAGLYCDMTSGNCAAKKADGQPCTDSSDCSSGQCNSSVCGAPHCATAS